LFRAEIDPEDVDRIRTAVNLGIGIADPRFREALSAIEQGKRRGGRRRKDQTLQDASPALVALKKSLL
jgi:hypothetical protein